jgi:hypothetical protein
MFNLSVVYMMYQPDHYCKVPGVNSTASAVNSTGAYLWGAADALQGSVVSLTSYHDFPSSSDLIRIAHHEQVYPRTRNKQRDMLNFHSQCHYYDRGEPRYDELRRMSLDEAQRLVNESGESVDIVKCQEWSVNISIYQKKYI